jgi:hypothetical protein
MCRMISINKIRRLLLVNFIIKDIMKENIFNIKLMNGLVVYGNREDSTNGNGLNNRTKGIKKINTRLLIKTFCHKSCFISFNSAITMY